MKLQVTAKDGNTKTFDDVDELHVDRTKKIISMKVRGLEGYVKFDEVFVMQVYVEEFK